jgi:hypothetical protein
MDETKTNPSKILILATLSGGYRGADGVGSCTPIIRLIPTFFRWYAPLCFAKNFT